MAGFTWTGFAAAAALFVAAAGAAQELPREAAGQPSVERRGAADVAIDQRLDRLLAADPLIVTRDTLIPAGDTVRRSVLVLDATLILEGVVTGDLVLVDGGGFIRPQSAVRGDLVNVGGGLYRSEVARIGGTILDLPTAPYRVLREPDRLVIEATGSPSRLSLDGFMGLQPPTYDRVNGATLVLGARYRLPRLGPVTPSVHGEVGWQTERGEPTYGGSVRLAWQAMALEGGYEKGSATNDEWIRGDLMNALNYAWDGDDFRDYHEAERAWAGVWREFGDVEKSFYGVLGVRGEVEDARSLRGDDPWHLLPGDPRPNPPVDDGRTTSVITSLAVEWHGRQTDFEGTAEYEAAREWLDGAFAFDRVELEGEWAMHALADHTLEIEFFIQQPLGSGILPRQEWSFLGGSGTLQTAEFGQFEGDHVVYVETKYIVPFPDRVALPILGAPELQLIHATGMAWTQEEDSGFRQEVGARLQFLGLYGRFMADPADLENNDLDVGLSWPFGDRYPWERR